MARVSDEAIREFSNWKIGKSQASYLVFQFAENGVIDITKRGEIPSQQLNPKESWEEIVQSLKAEKACWMACPFNYELKDGKRGKTLLIRWIPDGSSKEEKMRYAMFTNNIKAALSGVHRILQAFDSKDLERQTILSEVFSVKPEEEQFSSQ